MFCKILNEKKQLDLFFKKYIILLYFLVSGCIVLYTVPGNLQNKLVDNFQHTILKIIFCIIITTKDTEKNNNIVRSDKYEFKTFLISVILYAGAKTKFD